MNNTLELTAPITSAVAAPPAPVDADKLNEAIRVRNAVTDAMPAGVDVDKLDTAKPLVEIFAPYQTTLEKWEAKAKSLVVTDISMKTEMAQARLARLELKDARVAMDKTRKGLVENLKARTSKIDGTARIIREKIEGLEAILLESEEFAERYAAKVKAELKAKREVELTPWMDIPIVVDLSSLSETDYATILAHSKSLRQAKDDAAAKAEADRLAKEVADKAERERIAAENAKLKAEAIEAARVAEAERKRAVEVLAEQKAQAEEQRRAEKAKADAEMKKTAALRLAERVKADAAVKKAREELDRMKAANAAKAADEAAEREAREKEAERAAAAPDKAKLTALVRTLRGMDVPSFSNRKLASEVEAKFETFIDWIESQIDAELL